MTVHAESHYVLYESDKPLFATRKKSDSDKISDPLKELLTKK